MANRKTFRRMAKAERKSLKFWAEGIRETEILRPRLDEYMDALAKGWRAERACRQRICNEFHGRISWRVGDDEEPISLADYDPLAPIVEEELTAEESKLKWARIGLLNARIQRWLKYHARKISNKYTEGQHRPKRPSPRPICPAVPPDEALQGSQQFSKEHYYDLVLPEIQRHREEQQQKNGGAPLPPIKVNDRAAAARRLFVQLDKSEQKAYEQRAAEFAAREKAAFDAMAEAGYPKDAAWRARCSAISDMQAVLAPVLRQIHEMTGLQIICAAWVDPSTVVTISNNDPFKLTILSVGTNRAPSPVSFANYNARKFEEFTTFFKQYLATCY
ncbi:hypothetical protein C8F01DRAFT_1092705, partial [Mycena amicta]